MTRCRTWSRSGRAAAGFLLVLALLASGIATDHARAAASHARMERLLSEDLAAQLDGLEWTVGGGNVGVGSSLTDLQEAFLASKPHRRNILRKAYDHAAIGTVKSDGNLWVTVIFYG